VDFHFFKRKGGKISSGVQAVALGIRVKDWLTKMAK
jgi:hypothetical protein